VLATKTSGWNDYQGATPRFLSENETVKLMRLENYGANAEMEYVSRPTQATPWAVARDKNGNSHPNDMLNTNTAAKNVSYYLDGAVYSSRGYWLNDEIDVGTACSGNGIYTIQTAYDEGEMNAIACADKYASEGGLGIRPVIEVAKSKVKKNSATVDISNTVLNSEVHRYKPKDGDTSTYPSLQGFTTTNSTLLFYTPNWNDQTQNGYLHGYSLNNLDASSPAMLVAGAMGHGNGMTFNSKTNQVLINAEYNTWVLDASSLTKVGDLPRYDTIAYDSIDDRYFVSDWRSFYMTDSSLNSNDPSTFSFSTPFVETGQDIDYRNGYLYRAFVNFLPGNDLLCPNHNQLYCSDVKDSALVEVYNVKLNPDGTPSKNFGRRVKKYFISGENIGEVEGISFRNGKAYFGYATWDYEASAPTRYKFYAVSDSDFQIPFSANVSFIDGTNSTTILINSDDPLKSINGYTLINNGYTLKKELPNRNVGENNLQVCDNYNNCTTLSFAHVNPNIEKDIFELILDANGGVNGTTNPQCMVTSGTSCVVTIPTIDPTRDNYNFLGWADSRTATTATMQSGAQITLTANRTIYAVWEAVPIPEQTFTLSYDNNTGTGNISSQQCTTTTGSCNITITNDEPTKANYFFLGWAEESTATTATKHAGDSITLTADKTLYAIWAPIYTVSFDKKGGNGNVDTQTCHPNATSGSCNITIPNVTLTKDDYTFLGWSESDSATEASNYPGQIVSVSNDKTFYAVWKENETPGPDDPDDPGGTGEITWIQDQAHEKESKRDLIVRIDYPVEKFVSLMIDGTVVDTDNYTAISGSTVISIKYTYVDGLTTGEHTLVANYQNNITARTTFTVADAPEPGPEPGPEPEPTPEPTPGPDEGDEGDIVTPDTGSLDEKGFDGAMPVIATLTFLGLAGTETIIYKKQRQKEHIIFDE
jgi:uncharacterized repeat protein (TIGR02543 family)